MERRQLPGTDLDVSRLSLGCWGLTSDFHWGTRDTDASRRSVAAAIDAGVTLFDTAVMYGEGASEELLGQALGQRRRDVLVATKTSPGWQSAAEVREGLDASLRRLATDYVDLYQVHWPGSAQSLADIYGEMVRLRDEGKTRYIGVCNAGPQQMDTVARLEKPAVNQLPYNLLWRAIENEILPRCLQDGVGILAYSPLMHGMLCGKWTSAAEVPASRARSRHFSHDREHTRHGEEGCEALTFETIARLQKCARENNTDLTQLSLGWLAARPGVTSILVGVSSPEQLQANIDAVSRPLSEDLVAELDAITQPLRERLGNNPDMWQGSQASRYR